VDSLLSVADDYRLDLCWDRDVAIACRLALHHGESDCFNLTGDRPIDMNQIGELLDKPVVRLNLRWTLWCVRAAAALGLVSSGVVQWLKAIERGPINVSADRAKKRLGWQPKFDSTQTLTEFAKCTGIIPRCTTHQPKATHTDQPPIGAAPPRHF